jgi:ABC-type amino acid transport substrate-binding protein
MEAFMFRAMSACIAALVVAVIGMHDAAAQAVGGRLKAIANAKTIKVAHRLDATPFSFVNDRKEITGYTVDLCRQVVASIERQLGVQGLKVDWVPVTTQERFEAVASGKADMECGSSTITLGRMKQVDFSNIVFVESTGLVVRINAGINSLKDVGGKKIAVVAGTSNEQAVIARNQQLKLNAVIVPVRNRDEAVAALEAEQIDGFASDKLLLVGTRFKDNRQLRLLSEDLSIEPYAIVLPRGDWEMRLAVNTALAGIFRGEEMKKIFDRWFGQLGLQPGVLLGAAYVLGALSE